MVKERHYSPDFYFDRWADNDGKICATRNIFGRIVQFRISPSNATFEYYLYRDHQDLSSDEREAVGRDFFQPLRREGARITSRFIAGVPLDEVDVLLWAQFVASMRQRRPFARVGRLKPVERTEPSPANAIVKGDVASRYAEPSARKATAKNKVRWRQVQRSSSSGSSPSSALPYLAIDDDVVRRLLVFNWYLLDLAGSDHAVLTSDRPCIYTHAIDDPECVVSLPLSPILAFFAVPSDSNAKRDLLEITDQNRLITALNLSVVGQALRYAYSHSEKDESMKFFRRNLPFDLSE